MAQDYFEPQFDDELENDERENEELERQKMLAEKNKPIYKNFGLVFMIGGISSFVVAVAEQAFDFRFFSGSIYGLALFLFLIGIVLYRTN